MRFEDLIKRALKVRKKYDDYNEKCGIEWDVQNLMSGFVGDVGDLSKIIMAKNGLREMDKIDEKLSHELADCLWSIIVIADKCKINIADAFQTTMKKLDDNIDSLIKNK